MLDPASILAAIGTANAAYKTIKTLGNNSNEIWKWASKFLEAKTKIDVQAEQDKKKGHTSTQAFLAAVDLKRKQIELDEYIVLTCEGWVIKMWNEHKVALREQALEEAEADARAKRSKRIKQAQKDDDVKNVIIAFTIVCALLAAGSVGLVLTGVV
jgi:hypothetical protein